MQRQRKPGTEVHVPSRSRVWLHRCVKEGGQGEGGELSPCAGSTYAGASTLWGLAFRSPSATHYLHFTSRNQAHFASEVFRKVHSFRQVRSLKSGPPDAKASDGPILP